MHVRIAGIMRTVLNEEAIQVQRVPLPLTLGREVKCHKIASTLSFVNQCITLHACGVEIDLRHI